MKNGMGGSVMSSPRKQMVYNPDVKYISYSQLGAFNSCAYKHQLIYGRDIKPIMSNDKMGLGTALHQIVEAHLLNEDPDAALMAWANETSSDWLDYYGLTIEDEEADLSYSIQDLLGAQVANIVDTARALMPSILEELGEKWTVCFDKEGNPLVEYPVVAGIEEGMAFFGYVDAVLLEKATGLIWVVDFKTKSYIENDPEDDFETQTQLYAHALQRDVGVKINGSIIYQISTKVPKTPKQNKNGSMSRTDLHTTWDIYSGELVKFGLNPDDYQDMKYKLANKRFFHQIRTYRSWETLERAWAEFIEGVSFMLDSAKLFAQRVHRGVGSAPRSMNNFSCPRCTHRVFCVTEYETGDASHLIGHLYKQGDEE